MKYLLTVLSIMSLQAMATSFNPTIMERSEFDGDWSTWNTYCKAVKVYNRDRKNLEITAHLEDSLEKGMMMESWVSENGKTSELENLTVEVLKHKLVDEEEETNFSMGGRIEIQRKIHATKLHFKSDEVLGTKIQGCIPQPVKEITTYTICTTSRSRRTTRF